MNTTTYTLSLPPQWLETCLDTSRVRYVLCHHHYNMGLVDASRAPGMLLFLFSIHSTQGSDGDPHPQLRESIIIDNGDDEDGTTTEGAGVYDGPKRRRR
jgi:hypothetical protein